MTERRTTEVPTGVGKARQYHDSMLPRCRFSFKRTLGSVAHSCSHRKSSVTQLAYSMMILSICHRSRGGPRPRPITQYSFGVDPHARSNFLTPPSFHPPTLSITVIAKENVAFGTATSARAYGGLLPLRQFLSEMWDSSITCAQQMISFSRHRYSCRDNAMICRSNSPSNLYILSMFRLS